MVATAMMVAISVNAQEAGQLNFRFRAGGNLSTLTGSDDAKTKLGWTVGAGLDYNFTDQLCASLDLSHDLIGAKSKLADKNLNLEYLSFGPMFKYYANKWLALQAGPELGFLLSAKMDGTSMKDSLKKTELSLPIGVSFEPNVGAKDSKLVIDLRYRLGLSKVNKNDFGDDIRNSAFVFTLGYKFSLSD